jgi:hypothetical protein
MVALESWDKDLLRSLNFEIRDVDLEEKYTSKNCTYPIVPKFDEQYASFIIVCKTSTEIAAVQTKFNFPKRVKSYKNSVLGPSQVLMAEDIL